MILRMLHLQLIRSNHVTDYIRLYLPMTWLQLGQLWVTSLQPSTQKGMRQQPRSHPTKHNTKQMIQANVPVSYEVAVTISA